MFPRPKAGETEDDLLKFQREFLANQTRSAATVVRPGDKRKSDEGANRDVVKMDEIPPDVPPEGQAVKKSKFKRSQEEKNKNKDEKDFDPEEEIEKHDTHMAAVLTKIIERDTRNVQVCLPNPRTDGFPQAKHLDSQTTQQSVPVGGRKKKSLFAQQFSGTVIKDFDSILKQETNKATESEEMETETENNTDRECAGPHLIEGTGISATFGKDEAMKIHQENEHKLHGMSQDEILEEQRKLLMSLDPKLVEFLKKKKSTGATQSPSKSESATEHDKRQKVKKPPTKIDEDDLPIKLKKEWKNMDTMEYDKLEWMKNLPPPVTDSKETGQHARFDFHGNLMANDSNVPVNVGLHHHGDEPERPGYSLEELFHLARSTNNQQRTLALQTLSNIIQKVRQGELEALVQSPVLPALIDAGIMFLLRWALDDSVDMVMSSAVSALCSLLVSDADETSLDRTFSWHQGHCVPKHQPRSSEEEAKPKIPGEEENPEEADADLLKKDVILCLVTRMNFLPRLRYILTKTRPQAPTVLCILKMLCRVAHHSTKVAYDIFLCPGLLEVILEEFLPTSWHFKGADVPVSNVYGIPVSMAMRLMRCLAQAGRNMAASLLTDNQLQARLLRYMVEVKPCSLDLPESEAYQLQTESYRTWNVCLMYGLATEVYIDLFPVIIDKLKYIEDLMDSYSTLSQAQMDNITEFIGALEAAVHVAGSSNSQKAQFLRSQDGESMEVESSEVTAMPNINWGHVSDLLHHVSRSLKKVLFFIKDNYQFKKVDLQFAVACMNFLTTYYSRLAQQVGQSTTNYLHQIEEYCNDVLKPCWKSLGFRVIIERLSQFSNILNPPAEKSREKMDNLPSLGCSSVKEEQMLPVLQKGSPFCFVTGLLRQIHTFCQVHKGIQDKVLPLVLQDSDICSYMKKVSRCKQSHLHSNYFTRYENVLQYYYLKLAVMQNTETCLDTTVLQGLTLRLLTRLHYGDEYLAHDLFSTVIFRTSLWSQPTEQEAISSLQDMKLSDATHLKSATQEEITFTCSQLEATARTQLSSIRATYIKAFSYFEKEAFVSRNLFLTNPFEIKTFLTSSIEEFLLPSDWMYMPLIYLYNHFSSVGLNIQNALSIGETETVSNVLKWIFLLERSQPDVMATISITLKLSRLMCTFLTGNDLFLDKSVHSYLAAFLREWTKPVYLDKMNFEEEIPGMLSFYDFYTTLLTQYEAVSFGDSLFGCYILIPLQQKHGVSMRRAIWTEHRGILRIMYLPVKEMLVPVDRYLYPEETNIELIRLYYECLLSQSVLPKRAPVPYLVAIHHVNRFMYTQDGKHMRLKQMMLKEAIRGTNKELSHHLLYYKEADVSLDFGMELYHILPNIRQQLLDTLQISNIL